MRLQNRHERKRLQTITRVLADRYVLEREARPGEKREPDIFKLDGASQGGLKRLLNLPAEAGTIQKRRDDTGQSNRAKAKERHSPKTAETQ